MIRSRQESNRGDITNALTLVIAAAVFILAGLGFLAWTEMRTWGVTKREPRHVLALTQRANFRSALAHGGEGDALAKRGDIAAALRQYEEALRSEPTIPGIHNNLGTILSRMGKFDEAIEQYLAELKIDPGAAYARVNLGIALIKSGKPDEAAKHFREALRIEPNSAAAHYELGYVSAQLGRFDDAIHHFREALRVRPDFAQARENLERALALQGARERGGVKSKE
jgi:tetratricopeptide (TPR) repeat protein